MVALRPSTRPGTIRYRLFGDDQHRRDSVRVANVQQHPLGQLTEHLLGLQVHDEERLPAHDLSGVFPFLLEAGQDPPSMIAEADSETDEEVGSRHILDARYRTDADVDLPEVIERDRRLKRSGIQG